MKLSELVNVFPFLQVDVKEDPIIQQIEMDHRQVKAGTLFICINGYTVDGHDFAKNAVENGAVAVIAEKPLALDVPVIIVKDSRRAMARLANHFYHNPTKNLHLIGVTGTNGKTSTTLILEHIFQRNAKKTGVIGTMYAKVGQEKIETKNTTPESLLLQQTFQRMVHHQVDTALMEVSSHALESGRTFGCDFNVAVFTNLTPDHLDYHKTMEDYLNAKGLLFAQLGSQYDGKFAVLNIDDPASQKLMKMTSAEIITYSIHHNADISAKNIQLSAKGTMFELTIFNQTYQVDVQLIGKFNVYNILAAVAAAYVSGIPKEDIVKSLSELKGIAGRFETVKVNEKQDFTVVVDYAHTSDSLKNVLETVQELAQSSVKVVVGCGGNRDRSKRPVMAEVATKYAEQAYFTSDNPRGEDPNKIIDDMIKGISYSNYMIEVDRKKAIYDAISSAQSGDIIVIAGKGHETYQIFSDQTIHFDDREIAYEAIKERIRHVNI
ncbi:UDP-N-acetylmuramoyl-L-alanyl-D-glutamate--2,6-diaminopimelate ligase [Alkalihalobacillus trypoxylicola]|uniref:UDP-N-acetylmuramoyl-L-alanyl-D-glutamate--2,6-diaminopimelate ligase n=1 Tax=Alkalihalobacillus trypoxylicola TaxID=519424 RepID=A0A162FAU0_9BACI|nr:UDP-N-acetylmuramoyl-L-alanyl-D-glutamate--2,6-diaminopimelate ligase [Alkalihalobacillus trypoxylicola]KYG35178.1 UDP-N-acetylmuramoyl-L-alanyl-D-glutamate--2,6-diaminopimelate ligase [Alkalihalobacillus trypoxylicola]